MEKRDTLVEYINRTLDVGSYTDYCPNGLQVQGRENIQHIVSGVTASQAFLKQAITAGADAVLVHHGYFWRGESQPLVGMKLERIRLLLEADISLLAYHLPLDVHATFGNRWYTRAFLSWPHRERSGRASLCGWCGFGFG